MTLPIFYAFIYMCIPPRWHSGKQSSCQCRRHRRRGFNPRVRKIPWRRKWQPTPMFLPGKSHGQRRRVDYSPWDHKELDTTEHTLIQAILGHILCLTPTVYESRSLSLLENRRKCLTVTTSRLSTKNYSGLFH